MLFTVCDEDKLLTWTLATFHQTNKNLFFGLVLAAQGGLSLPVAPPSGRVYSQSNRSLCEWYYGPPQSGREEDCGFRYRSAIK